MVQRGALTAWCAGNGLQLLPADLGLLDLCLGKRAESVCDVTMVESRGLTALVRHPNADQLGLGRAHAIWPAGAARSSACPVAPLERWMRVPARGRGRHRQRLAACPTRGCPPGHTAIAGIAGGAAAVLRHHELGHSDGRADVGRDRLPADETGLPLRQHRPETALRPLVAPQLADHRPESAVSADRPDPQVTAPVRRYLRQPSRGQRSLAKRHHRASFRRWQARGICAHRLPPAA